MIILHTKPSGVSHLQQLDDIACAEDFMWGCEFEGFRRWEVGGKNTFVSASAAEDFAGCTRADHNWRKRRRRRCNRWSRRCRRRRWGHRRGCFSSCVTWLHFSDRYSITKNGGRQGTELDCCFPQRAQWQLICYIGSGKAQYDVMILAVDITNWNSLSLQALGPQLFNFNLLQWVRAWIGSWTRPKNSSNV